MVMPIDTDRLILIVTGSTLRAEMADRPIAETLRSRMFAWRDGEHPHADPPGAPNARPYDVVICSDLWYLNDESLHLLPTVSVGGPGVNAAAAHLADKTPSAFVVDDTLIVQMDPELRNLQASVWGMDNETTLRAMDVFLDRYLDQFMRAADERLTAVA